MSTGAWVAGGIAFVVFFLGLGVALAFLLFSVRTDAPTPAVVGALAVTGA